MNMFKKVLLAGVVIFGLVLSGCPPGSMDKASELTVGGVAITANLKAGDEHWYKVALEEAEIYDFIFKRNANGAHVGVVLTVYWNDNDTLSLMWQAHFDPRGFVQVTDESTVVNKQREIAGFLAPGDGDYFIVIKGYEQDDGRQQRNTYAYDDILVYSIAVKYTPSQNNPQGEAIEVRGQAANVPYINNIIEIYETVFHPVELEKGERYQLQTRPGDVVDASWWTAYGQASTSMYYTAPYDGEFYIRIATNRTGFGYTEYGLRVQQDDHGHTNQTATKIDIGDTVNGYLGQGDADFFTVTIPARPADTQEYRRYRVTITPRDRFWLDGLTIERDEDHEELESYVIVQSDTQREVRFSVKTTAEYSYLDDDPDGAGAYTIRITAL